jgi:HlyD family secretion protein
VATTGSEVPAPIAASDLEKLRIDRTAPAAARRRRGLVPWLVTALVLAAIAATVFATMGEELFAPQVNTARVQRVTATEGLVRTTASGYVVARKRAAISSRLSGRLEKLTVDVGVDVTAGQLLGQLGHADLDAAVEQAHALVAVRTAELETLRRESAATAAAAAAAQRRVAETEAMTGELDSRLANAARTLERETALMARKVTSQESLDRATMERDVAAEKVTQVKARVNTLRAEADQAQIEAGAAEARLTTAAANVAAAEAGEKQAAATRQDADVVAPFAGRVLRKEAEIGEMVAPVNSAGSTTRGAIVTLADFTSLEMEVDVIERDIGLIEEGAPCRILLDSRRDHPYAGFVRQIVPTADRTKSTVQVKVGFRALDANVLPEMSGRVEFLKTGTADATILGHDRVFAPRAALVERNARRGAFEVKERRAVWHDVTQPADPQTKDDLVEIATGFTGGEDVVVSPPDRLKEGALVRVPEPKK